MNTAYLYQLYPDSLQVLPQAGDLSTQPDESEFPVSDPANAVRDYSVEIPDRLFRFPAAKKIVAPDTVIVKDTIIPEPAKPETWNSSTNFFLNNGLKGILREKKDEGTSSFTTLMRPSKIIPEERVLVTQDWILGIFLLVTVLLIWIRLFYGKFYAILANSMISYQISAKLFRERNVFLHRVSFVLDFTYVLVLSVFLFELDSFYGITAQATGAFNFFLIIFNVIVLYTVLRVIALRLTGSLFMVRSVFKEYIHNTFVINKGAGLALFPIVIMVHYFPKPLIPLALLTGMVVYLASFILKTMRAYQIIIRKDVLLFYLILYLCTLEILPLLLGFKFVTTLI